MASSVAACSDNPSRKALLPFSRKSRAALFAAVVVCLAVTAATWITAALATVHTMADPAAPKQSRLQASLDLPAAGRAAPVERNVKVRKFARLSKTPADQLWPAGLTAAAIRAHHDRRVALAASELKLKAAERARAFAALRSPQAEKVLAAALPAAAQPTMVAALVDPRVARDDARGKPFDLVMPEADRAATAELPDTIPLPEARPKALARAGDDRPEARRAKPAARELAYANPAQVDTDDAVRRETRPSLFGTRHRSRGRTAYYDISAGVVHLPNGERLEAHSGIGNMRDNPKYVHVKMRGSTPPGVFRLSMREKLFHGVQALRMTPVDGVNPHGRDGLLTHSYLLGRNGNSHGCVAFKNYPRFLAAYKRGEIDTLVVVPSMGSQRLAAIFGKRS